MRYYEHARNIGEFNLLSIIFRASPKKLWPGCNEDLATKRLNSQIDPGQIDFVEIEVCEIHKGPNRECREHSLFTERFGFVLGKLREIFFVERILSDQLPHTTRLGNAWHVLRFVLAIGFFTAMIVLSGGASSSFRIINITQSVGIWMITEFAFVKAILSASRLIETQNRLGVSLRAVVVGSFLSMWRELLTLVIFCNFLFLFSEKQILPIEMTVHVLWGVFYLFLLFIPVALVVATFSRRWTDARFLVAPIFRLFIFATPIFYSYYSEFTFLGMLLEYLPTNLAFLGIILEIKPSSNLFLSAGISLLLVFFLWLFPISSSRTSCWVQQK
jgi:hypothetical protein